MQPKLSVCIITYNHQAFIRQALEGVVMQQCTFDWEVVIGDDYSTDGTSDIVKEYAKKYPGRIRINDVGHNLGMTENWLKTIAACKGEYIALLEGDDYWTDPLKLEKQVALLGNNPKYSYTCHDVETIFDAGMPTIDYLYHPGISKEYTIEEFINWRGNFFVPTGSIVFRRSMLGPYPAWANRNLKSCIDLTTELMLAMQGPFFYINEVMGKYRIHAGGVSQIIWLGKEHLFEFDVIHIYTNFDTFTKGAYHKLIKDRVEWLCLSLLRKNPLESEAYKRALFLLLRINPRKHFHLFKGWLIGTVIPTPLYKAYKRLF